MTPASAAAEEARLRAAHETCGCDVGAACAIVAVVIYVVWLVQADSSASWKLVLGGVGVFAAAGALGKAVAILNARRRLHRALRLLRAGTLPPPLVDGARGMTARSP